MNKSTWNHSYGPMQQMNEFMNERSTRQNVGPIMWNQQQGPIQSLHRTIRHTNRIPPLMRRLTPTPERLTRVYIPQTTHQGYLDLNSQHVQIQPHIQQHTIKSWLGDFTKSLNLLITQFQQLTSLSMSINRT